MAHAVKYVATSNIDEIYSPVAVTLASRLLFAGATMPGGAHTVLDDKAAAFKRHQDLIREKVRGVTGALVTDTATLRRMLKSEFKPGAVVFASTKIGYPILLGYIKNARGDAGESL